MALPPTEEPGDKVPDGADLNILVAKGTCIFDPAPLIRLPVVIEMEPSKTCQLI